MIWVPCYVFLFAALCHFNNPSMFYRGIAVAAVFALIAIADEVRQLRTSKEAARKRGAGAPR